MQFRGRMAGLVHLALIFSFIFVFFGALEAPRAQAQTRVNHHDMEALLKNLRDDAKSFRPRFDSAVSKSTIRKTSQEREAHDVVAAFQHQTETMFDNFKKDRNGQAEFTDVMASAKDINKAVHTLSLGSQITSDWSRIRTELHHIAAAYGVPDSFEQAGDGLAPMRGDTTSCLQSAGAEKAKRLVNQCLQVSPATHPPCNAENSCALIISEIRRSCALMGTSAPEFCDDYR